MQMHPEISAVVTILIALGLPACSSGGEPPAHAGTATAGDEEPAPSPQPQPPTTVVTTRRVDANDCPNPNNDCLEAGVVFVAQRPLKNRYIYVQPALPTGDGKYRSVRTGQLVEATHVHETKPANRNTLAVGQMVVVPFNKGQRVFRGPQTRKAAYETRWWLTRIASIADINLGYVMLAGGHRVAADAVRVVVGDETGVRPAMDGALDGHFLTPQHVFVTTKPLPKDGYVYADTAVLLKPNTTSSAEGPVVMRTRDGEVGKAEHLYRTRKAAQGDLKLGQHVFMPYHQRAGVFVAPENREQALNTRWWAAKITDVSTLGKGEIKVYRGYRVAADAVRVPLP